MPPVRDLLWMLMTPQEHMFPFEEPVSFMRNEGPPLEPEESMKDEDNT